MLIVTHDRYLANRIADRILIMDAEGTREFEGDWDAYKQFLSESAAAKEKAPFQAPFGLVGKGGYLVAASLTDRRDFLRLALDLWMTPDFAALSNAELSLR